MAKSGNMPAMGSGLSELWARLRFVLLAIVVYRIGAHIPVPGINPDQPPEFIDDAVRAGITYGYRVYAAWPSPSGPVGTGVSNRVDATYVEMGSRH